MNPLFKMLLLLVLACLHSLVACAQMEVPGQDTESCIVYIPTAISPNADGINDAFQVQHVCSLEGYRLRIYDAGERMVYESRDVNSTWGGSYQGEPLPEGYYTWELTYYDARSGNRVLDRGEFALVR